MRAVRVTRFGGPEVLELVELPDPIPGPGELLVEVAYAGVNFRDLLHRAGGFGATLPFVAGTEGAGRVKAVGDAVSDFVVGDRVAWKSGPSYAQCVCVSASESIRLPDDLDFELAAAICLQGITAHALTTSAYACEPGATALVHAGAGGVGGLVVQCLKRRGATVIATVSTEEKAAAARTLGADEVIVYGTGAEIDAAPLVAEVRERTDGRGVEVVFDGVGRSTFDVSLASCRVRGVLVLYGASSGSVPPFEVMRLMSSGSVTLMRPSVRDFTADRLEFDRRGAELFRWVGSGAVVAPVTGRFSLDQAGTAQELLASRRSTGKLLLSL